MLYCQLYFLFVFLLSLLFNGNVGHTMSKKTDICCAELVSYLECSYCIGIIVDLTFIHALQTCVVKHDVFVVLCGYFILGYKRCSG